MQQLILPIQKSLITAGYQNTAYRQRFGFSHFGQDYVSTLADRSIFASGTGKVLLAGLDALFGQVLIVLYPKAYHSRTKKTSDLILRYYHLDSISVKTGDLVTNRTLLGKYGSTGRYLTGPHLHIEADYDTKYFAYSATTKRNSTLIQAGIPKTMCAPTDFLFCKKTEPELQSFLTTKGSFAGIPYIGENDIAPAFVAV